MSLRKPETHSVHEKERRQFKLDTAVGCAEALAHLTTELDKLPAGWAKDEKRLAEVEEALATHEAVAILAADGATATEKKAQAQNALSSEETTADLLTERATLRGQIEGRRRVFNVKDRQSNNIQSLLSYHRDELGRGDPHPNARP